MLTVNNLGLSYGNQQLFKDVNIKFTPGNCYGVIGANGAGKSTFLKILSNEIDADTGDVFITPGERMAVLKQDHFQYEDFDVLEAVIMGNEVLYNIMKEKDAIYDKEDFTDEDGVRASELEIAFSEMEGWEADSQAASILKGLGVKDDSHYKKVKDLEDKDKIKVLLAQALFGNPDILLLDEPTNHLDIKSIVWLEYFIQNLKSIVIVVSHDRHFLNKVCTHIADIDYSQIKIFVGNYDFWKESSDLALKLRQKANQKISDKRKELASFIQRFSANASKAKQATSRSKLLEKLTLEDLQPTSRKYPYINFKPKRDIGNTILTVEDLNKSIDGVKILNNISFDLQKGDKVALVGENEIAKSMLIQVLSEEEGLKQDSGEFKWGVTVVKSYLPKDNSSLFNGVDYNLIDWMRQFSEEREESTMRSFLGRMLFSGEEVYKKVEVLSGGEKVRCVISKLMLTGANTLLLDGPTNHLDLESISSFNDALINFKGILLMSSHDHKFIQTVANKILEVKYDGTIELYHSTFDEYLEKKIKESKK